MESKGNRATRSVLCRLLGAALGSLNQGTEIRPRMVLFPQEMGLERQCPGVLGTRQSRTKSLAELNWQKVQNHITTGLVAAH